MAVGGPCGYSGDRVNFYQPDHLRANDVIGKGDWVRRRKRDCAAAISVRRSEGAREGPGPVSSARIYIEGAGVKGARTIGGKNSAEVHGNGMGNVLSGRDEGIIPRELRGGKIGGLQIERAGQIAHFIDFGQHRMRTRRGRDRVNGFVGTAVVVELQSHNSVAKLVQRVTAYAGVSACVGSASRQNRGGDHSAGVSRIKLSSRDVP